MKLGAGLNQTLLLGGISRSFAKVGPVLSEARRFGGLQRASSRRNLSPSTFTLDFPTMLDQSHLYYTVGAFLLGAYLTSVWTSRIRDGEHTIQDSKQQVRQQPKNASRFSKINNLDTLKKNIEDISQALQKGAGDVKQGIEGCIGNTPLIKIKSLSEATGCEILAKAEVKQMYCIKLVVANEVE